MAQRNGSGLATYAVIALLLAVIGGVGWFALSRPAPASISGALAPKESDIGMGDPKAPVTLIEYASLDCPHCATFSAEILPKLKTAFIDTGKLYYVLRDFPRTPAAAAGAIVARCGAAGQYHPIMALLFQTNEQWLGPSVPAPREALITVAARAGLTREQVEACLQREDVLAQINDVAKEAAETLKLQAVPLIYVNGTEVSDHSYEGLEKAINAALAVP